MEGVNVYFVCIGADQRQQSLFHSYNTCFYHMRQNHPFFFLLFLISFQTLAQQSYSFQKDDSILKKNYFEQSLKKKSVLLSSVDRNYVKDYKEIYETQFKEIGSLLQS